MGERPQGRKQESRNRASVQRLGKPGWLSRAHMEQMKGVDQGGQAVPTVEEAPEGHGTLEGRGRVRGILTSCVLLL